MDLYTLYSVKTFLRIHPVAQIFERTFFPCQDDGARPGSPGGEEAHRVARPAGGSARGPPRALSRAPATNASRQATVACPTIKRLLIHIVRGINLENLIECHEIL